MSPLEKLFGRVGISYKWKKRMEEKEEFWASGDLDVWPFIRLADFKKAQK